MRVEQYKDERTRAYEQKFEGAAAPAPDLERWRNGQPLARKALITGFMFLAFAGVDGWLKTVPHRQREEARSYAISDATCGVIEAVDNLRREDISAGTCPPEKSYAYVKTVVLLRLIEGYRERMAWRMTAAEKREWIKNYRADFYRATGEYPVLLDKIAETATKPVPASALVPDDVEGDFFATIADSRTSAECYIDLFAADDLEAAILREKLSHRKGLRTNYVHEIQQQFPGKSEYEIKQALKTLKERIAADLGFSVAELEAGTPSIVRLACGRLRTLVAA